MNSQEKEDRFEAPLYPKIPITLVKGKGTKLWDANGKEYLDLMAGQGAANVGNCNPEVVEAVHRQMQELINCYNPLYSPVRAELLEKLVSITPGKMTHAYPCNSGTESMEAALKFARFTTGRKEFVCFKNAFHGRTMGSLSATWKPQYKEPFEPLLAGFTHIPFNDIAAVRETVTPNTAAVIMELVQGESGVLPAEKEFVKAVREKCDETGALLIIDEIQTGFARTGKMFATEHYGIEPDMVCLAKSIAGGLPMGALVFNDRVRIDKKLHGTTFGGNPVVCAASLAAIRFMEEHHLAENAQKMGEYFKQQLSRINSPKIKEVRGMGLMIGLDLREKPASYLKALADEGVLALPAGVTVMRFLPPLIITAPEIDFAVEKIKKVLE